jgi:hypothetical protein
VEFLSVLEWVVEWGHEWALVFPRQLVRGWLESLDALLGLA